MTKSNSLLGTWLVLAAGTLWGLMGIFVRYYNQLGLGSLHIVSIRVLMTALILAAVLFVTRRDLMKIRWKDAWIFFGTGVLSVITFTYCSFSAMERTSIAVSAVLMYTSPIFVMLMSILFFKEKLTVQKIVACALALAGCVFVVGLLRGGEVVPLDAMLFGIGSAVGYALYSIFGRVALNRGYHTLTITLYTFLFASVGVIPLADFSTISVVFTRWDSVAMLFGIAIIPTVLPYILYTAGLERIESSRASIIASIEPVVATLVSTFVFSEPMYLDGVLGIALVLSSIVVLNITRKSKSK